MLRWLEQPESRSRWHWSQFGHSVCFRNDIPDSRNLVLDWRSTPLSSSSFRLFPIWQFARVLSSLITVVETCVVPTRSPSDDLHKLCQRWKARYSVPFLGCNTLTIGSPIQACYQYLPCLWCHWRPRRLHPSLVRWRGGRRSQHTLSDPPWLQIWKEDFVPPPVPRLLPIVSVPWWACSILWLGSNALSVSSVGGTNHIPETAAPFSGGGFSNYVRPL